MDQSTFNKTEKNPLSVVILLGATLVLTGLILFASNFGWISSAFKSIIISWPMLLILLAIIGYCRRQIMLPTILLVTGAFFLLPRIDAVYPGLLGNLSGNFTSNFWPILLIFIGLVLIIGVVSNRKKKVSSFMSNIVNKDGNTSGESGWIVKDLVFGGSESVFLDPVLKGGNIDVVFSGAVIDLRKTTLPDTTVYINIDAVFGGVTFYVPEGWRIQTNFDSVFGGYNDKRLNVTVSDDENGSKLVLQGSLIFSGCTIQ